MRACAGLRPWLLVLAFARAGKSEHHQIGAHHQIQREKQCGREGTGERRERRREAEARTAEGEPCKRFSRGS
eukprot:4343976-Pleurochrysis_carterae.AAC.1